MSIEKLPLYSIETQLRSFPFTVSKKKKTFLLFGKNIKWRLDKIYLWMSIIFDTWKDFICCCVHLVIKFVCSLFQVSIYKLEKYWKILPTYIKSFYNWIAFYQKSGIVIEKLVAKLLDHVELIDVWFRKTKIVLQNKKIFSQCFDETLLSLIPFKFILINF